MKVYITHSIQNNEFVVTLVELLREDGHEVFMSSETVANTTKVTLVFSSLRSIDVFIAILTEENSRVFYELGLAIGVRVPILITAPTNELLPFDVVSLPYVRLTGNNLIDAHTIVL